MTNKQGEGIQTSNYLPPRTNPLAISRKYPWRFLENTPGDFSKMSYNDFVEYQKKHITRAAKSPLECALADTRVVAIQGARQTGKSTLAKELAVVRKAKYLTLDTASVRSSAHANPADFVRQMPDGLLVIDEIQRVPNLLLEIKEMVDSSARPGQFLITGSSDLSKLSEVQESLAGRLERIELMPFSQQELSESKSTFLSKIFTQDYQPTFDTSKLTRSDYLNLAIRGGYPEAYQRDTKQRRDRWFDNYTKLLFEQEFADNKYSGDSERVTKFLNYLASISGSEIVVENVCNDMALKRYGVEQLIAYLARLFLIEVLPAWSTNLTSRTVQHQKVFLKDSGLTSRLLRANSTTATDLESPIAGRIFETFVFNELLRMASTGKQRLDFYHFRDMRKREVDIVIENDEGKLLLIEVKASSTVTSSDFDTIRYLQEKHKHKIVQGIVIYTGAEILPFGERQLALPAQCLWQ